MLGWRVVDGADSSGRGGIRRNPDADTSAWARPDHGEGSGGSSDIVLGEARSDGAVRQSVEHAESPPSEPSPGRDGIRRDPDADTSAWARPDDAEGSRRSLGNVPGDAQSDGTMPPSAEQAGLPPSAPHPARIAFVHHPEVSTNSWARADDGEAVGGGSASALAEVRSVGNMPPSAEQPGIARRHVFRGAAGIAVLAVLVWWAIGRDSGDPVATIAGDGVVTTQAAAVLSTLAASTPEVGVGAIPSTNSVAQPAGCPGAGGPPAPAGLEPPPDGRGAARRPSRHGRPASRLTIGSRTRSPTRSAPPTELSAIGADATGFIDEAVLGQTRPGVDVRSGQRPRAHPRIRGRSAASTRSSWCSASIASMAGRRSSTSTTPRRIAACTAWTDGWISCRSPPASARRSKQTRTPTSCSPGTPPAPSSPMSTGPGSCLSTTRATSP